MNNLTVTQLLIAAGVARNMNKQTICFYADCSRSYLYKELKNEEILKLAEQLKGLDPDPDNLKFKNIGTLYADIGKLLYNHGIKTIINGEK